MLGHSSAFSFPTIAECARRNRTHVSSSAPRETVGVLTRLAYKGWPTSMGSRRSGLVREFKKGPRAVDGIDLAVAPGEIYGFLGPNGAGKSTTVLMLTTLLPPTAGTARVARLRRRQARARRCAAAIGAALQEAALDPLLTGREHLRLQATLQGCRAPSARRRGDELLERVGLPRPPTARCAATRAG